MLQFSFNGQDYLAQDVDPEQNLVFRLPDGTYVTPNCWAGSRPIDLQVVEPLKDAVISYAQEV